MTTETKTPEDTPIRSTTAAARGTVYGTLASLFAEPDESMYATLEDGTLEADLERLVARTELDVTAPSMTTRDEYDLLCARFNDIFEIGYPDPPVPLYESEYQPEGSWDDVNLDLARAYDYFDVSVDDSEREHHDHLQLELEFAGYLARLAAVTDDDAVRQARRDFLDRHLESFVASIEDAIDDEVETGIYDDVVSFMERFVTADLGDLQARLDSEVNTT